MRKSWIFLLTLLLTCLSHAGAADDNNELVVLDEETFVKIATTAKQTKILQLYKVQGDRLNLTDAIEVDSKQVNFKTLFEYRHLKIEEKR